MPCLWSPCSSQSLSLVPVPAPCLWSQYLVSFPHSGPCSLSLCPVSDPVFGPVPVPGSGSCSLSLPRVPVRSPCPRSRCRSLPAGGRSRCRVSPWAPARGSSSSSCRCFSSSCPSSPPAAAGRCQDEAEEAAARPGRSRLCARGVAVPARRRPRRRRPPSHGPAGPQRPDRRYRGGGGEACAAPGSPGEPCRPRGEGGGLGAIGRARSGGPARSGNTLGRERGAARGAAPGRPREGAGGSASGFFRL